jgi:hypothetical protein
MRNLVRVGLMCTVGLLLAVPRDASAQTVFRGFIGPAQATCDDGFGTTAGRQLVTGVSIGKYNGPHIEFSGGGIAALCSFKPERWLVFGGFHVFPVVLQRGRIRAGIALLMDWDIPEMQRSFAGEGSGDSYLFFRPALEIQPWGWSFGETFVRDGKRYPAGFVSIDSQVGRYRYSGNYISVGIGIHLN